MQTEEKVQTSPLWAKDITVDQKTWTSPFLLTKGKDEGGRKGKVIMRWIANLEKVNPPTHSDGEDDDSDIEDAKSNGTYKMFRDDILRGAKDVTWKLVRHLPNGSSQIVPEKSYLRRMSWHEDDLEQQDITTGEITTADRIVPDGFYSGLFREDEMQEEGTRYQFTLSWDKPFIIRKFRMDTFRS